MAHTTLSLTGGRAVVARSAPREFGYMKRVAGNFAGRVPSRRALAVEKYSWQGLISALEPKLRALVRRTGGTAEAGMRRATLQG
jgi:hypothetical protein